MRRQLMWIVGLMMLIGGCLSPVRTAARVGTLEKATEAMSDVKLTGGGDVLNVSPTLAVSGGGGILVIVTLISWLRSRRTLKAVVKAIEEMADGREAKQQVARTALQAGVADYLHGHLQRWLKK